jgi:omega-amidase
MKKSGWAHRPRAQFARLFESTTRGSSVKVTVSIAQIEVARSVPEVNLQKGELLAREAAGRGSDLICFPEMWTTGFDWEANKRMAPEQVSVVERVAAMARENGIWISGSMLTTYEQGRASNTHLLFDREGVERGRYTKSHLFSMIREHEHEAAGNSLGIVETPWGKTGLAVCYDLRFPELFRTYAIKGVGLTLLPSAFPDPRMAHWNVLVKARAIEDQMFMVAANQVGAEAFGPAGRATYFGDSLIVDPWGETVAEAAENHEELVTATIDMDSVDRIRAKMTVLRDRRPELYDLDGPPPG